MNVAVRDIPSKDSNVTSSLAWVLKLHFSTKKEPDVQTEKKVAFA